MNTAERITQEVQRLPESLAQQVLDFIGYIEFKHGLKNGIAEELKVAQEPAMAHIWDNPEDEIWNDL